MLDLQHPVEGLRGAEYNPRAISDDALESLKKSITEIGFAKPIIVTRAGLILAGHQRTKAARALGLTHVPAFVLDTVRQADEVWFNQLHNGTDLDDIDEAVHIDLDADAPLGFSDAEPSRIRGNLRCKGATIRGEIANMTLRYGLWGCAVVTRSGIVVSSPQYALACLLRRVPCRVFRIEDHQADIAKSWFTKQYGEFSYGHLPRSTYIQTFAQMFRLRQGKKENRSSLYEGHVIAPLKKSETLLDFGCGQADYVKHLRASGYRVWGIELFHRKGRIIDGQAVRRMIDDAVAHVKANGRFDVVLSDSVLNSVDSTQAEGDVLSVLSAFCKPGGRVYFSGRDVASVERSLKANIDVAAKQRTVQFLDANGLTGILRGGVWYYQKFHVREQAMALAEKFFGDTEAKHHTNGSSWQVCCTKKKELPLDKVEASLTREFDMAWPEGQSVGRAEQALETYRAALAREAVAELRDSELEVAATGE